MYNLPKKSKGAVLTAENWNNSVEAIQDALNRSADFQTMLPSVQSASRWTGGRSVVDKGGFSLRSLIKEGETWKAYFNPGRVLEIHAGGARVIVPKMGADKMDSVPYPALEAQDGDKVYLDLVWGDNSHDCITEARISTEETPPGGRSARLTLGEFVSAAQSSGSSADDITYTPFLTGCITYASGSRNEGWRVLAVADAEGKPKAAYLRRGNIYAFGKLVSEGGMKWENAPAKEGDIWLNVKFDGDGNYKSFSLAKARGEVSPLPADGLKDGKKPDSASYAFKLATISTCAEPFPEDGNPASFVNVRQFVLGSVFCDLSKSEAQEEQREDGNEGFRVKVEKDASGNVIAVKVRPGHVYIMGRFCTTALEAGADGWAAHAATSGQVWLVVQFDEWGVFESAWLSSSQPSTATLTPFILSTEATGIRGQYAFHLADVEADGSVKQYALGAVYCLFDPATFFTPGPAE